MILSMLAVMMAKITVVSNSLIGNSGLIKQSYNQIYTLQNSFLEDLSVTVVDNDEAARDN